MIVGDLDDLEQLLKLAKKYRVDRLEVAGVIIEKRSHEPAVVRRRAPRRSERDTDAPNAPTNGRYEEEVLFHSSGAPPLQRGDLARYSSNTPPDQEKPDGQA